MCDCTPVLFFGQWKTSKVVTVGLNPSKREFHDKDGVPLKGGQQRFCHWPKGDLMQVDEAFMDEAFMDEAFRRAEGYFTLGNAYEEWFRHYGPFLEALGCSYGNGSACHTDYESPFATKPGIGKLPPKDRERLRQSGLTLWHGVLSLMPKVQIIIGHGWGWKEAIPKLMGIDWEGMKKAFDSKGGKTKISKPYLLFACAHVGRNNRAIAVYWWKPNYGLPLTWLSDVNKRKLGRWVRDHAERQGFLT